MQLRFYRNRVCIWARQCLELSFNVADKNANIMLSLAVFTVLIKCVSVAAYISWCHIQSAEIC